MTRIFAHRLAITVVALSALAVLIATAPAREAIAFLIERAGPVIEAHPVAGALTFVALAVVSATMTFVSSIALVPIAIGAWGPATAAILLWVGWFIGGNLAYALGFHLGRPIVGRLASPARLAQYEHRVSRDAPFLTALVVMLTMPSDVAGYLFGILGYPRRRFIPALALSEIPYAVLAAYVGDAVLGDRPWIPAALMIVGVSLTLALVRGVRDRASPAADQNRQATPSSTVK